MPRPLVFLPYHARSGVVALNVVAAALGADPRTAAVPVRFVKRSDAVGVPPVMVQPAEAMLVIWQSTYATWLPG